MSKNYLITGANSGLGLDAARQLALREDVAKVYLACRSQAKAESAMKELVAQKGVSQSKLVFVKFDGSAGKADIEKDIAATIPSSVVLHGLVLNAGGAGSDTEGKPTAPNNMIPIDQINFAAHIHLVDFLLHRGNLVKDQSRVIFSGSEGSRGIQIMGMASSKFEGDTAEYYQSYLDGTIYKGKYDAMGAAYADAKGLGTLYFGAWARNHPEIFVLTVSPGGTKGTAFASHESISAVQRMIFPIIMTLFGWFGYFHKLEVGAKRYVDAVVGQGEYATFKSGSFIASKSDAASGPVADQAECFETGKQYGDVKKQDAAYQAINALLY